MCNHIKLKVLLSNSLAFRMMSSSLPEGTWRTLTVSKMVFKPISDLVDQRTKGKLKILISHPVLPVMMVLLFLLLLLYLYEERRKPQRPLKYPWQFPVLVSWTWSLCLCLSCEVFLSECSGKLVSRWEDKMGGSVYVCRNELENSHPVWTLEVPEWG